MVTRIPVSPGIDGIPTNTIPDDPSQFVNWFKTVGLKRWFANADVRNAIPGSGVGITGTIATPATVSLNQEILDLLVQPLVLATAPVDPGLSDYRVLKATAPVALTDGGAEGSLTITFNGLAVENSITGAGTAASPLELVGDVSAPGNSFYYGTNASGVKGWYVVPTGTVTTADSVQGSGTAGSPIELVGDSASPGNTMLYGTNGSGTKGWYAQPGGSGGVTSVGLADTSTTPIYTVSGSPVTASGTIDLTLKTQSANLIFAGPTTGSASPPTFRGMVGADLPSISYLNAGNITPDSHLAIPTGIGLGPNDEFETGTTIDTGGTRYTSATPWAWVAQSTATTAISEGAILYAQTSATGSYILQANPSGSWTITAKFYGIVISGSLFGGLAVYNSANTKGIVFGTTATTGATFDVFLIVGGTFSSSIISSITPPNPTGYNYVQISFNSTTNIFSFAMSATGVPGSFLVQATTAPLSDIGAITGVGFFNLGSGVASGANLVIDWFRRTA